MFVVIAGGGRTGAQLASLLVSQDHDVRVVENRPDVLERIHRELPTEAIIEGDPVEVQVLEEAGIQRADVMAACTTSDEINLTLCYVSRTRYNVPRTIARVNNPRDAWLFDSKFHVDVAVNQAEILASLIQEEMSLGDMITLHKLRKGKFDFVEEKIAPDAKANGKKISEISLPRQSTIVAVLRHGELIIPHGDLVFETADEVLSIVHQSEKKDLAKLFDRA